MKSKLLYERALITCVLMLIVSIILKLFGVPWFNLDTSIPILNTINDIVMNNVPLSFLYTFVFRMLNTYLIYIICCKSLKINILKLSCLVIASIFFHYFVENDILCFIVDFNMTLLLCYKTCSLRRYYSIMILNTLYQLISLFIRNIGVQVMNYGLITSILLNIDYYIMLIMTYLYTKGGNDLCSTFHVCYSSLATKLWRKPTQNSNQCSSKES